MQEMLWFDGEVLESLPVLRGGGVKKYEQRTTKYEVSINTVYFSKYVAEFRSGQLP